MKNSIYLIQAAMLCTMTALPVLPSAAQNNGDKEKVPVLFVPSSQNISSNENILRLNVSANIPFEVKEDYDWVEVFKKDNKTIYLKFDQNFENESREADISVFNKERQLTRHFMVTQSRDNSINDVPDENHPEFSIFADNLYSTLKEEVTTEQIQQLTNPFIKSLAYKIFNKTYDTKYRVADYECWLSTKVLANEWKCGQYDQMAGVTGINIPANSKQAIIVRGIPENVPVELRLQYWYRGGTEREKTENYPLHNGINIIENKQHGYDALAYICYYAEKNPENYKDISVHFVNGEVNGYITQDMTNEEIHKMCGQAKNKVIDLLSEKVHAVWTAEGLYKYSKSRDGKLGYRQQMNLTDSLITWEQRSLGIYKYNRVPKNRTMIYVNFGTGVFCSGTGASFGVGNETHLFDMQHIIDGHHSIWGMSHEWGHQHQLSPYFKWTWLTEVTNNVQSYYNSILSGDDIWNDRKWPNCVNLYFNDSQFSSGKGISEYRQYIYDHRDMFKYSPKLYKLCEEMKGGVVAALKENPLRAVSYVDTNLDAPLCAFIKFFDYFYFNGHHDLLPDMYESLRQNDYPMGSQIEKQGFLDKYELLASAQNKNTNNALAAYREKYPESCWVKDNYIDENHCHDKYNAVPFIMNFIRKVSRLTGYDVTPYFEGWGYLRQIAFGKDDYGYKYYLMTKEMYNEFKSDMAEMVESGEIKEMPEGMIDAINNCRNPKISTPYFPN